MGKSLEYISFYNDMTTNIRTIISQPVRLPAKIGLLLYHQSCIHLVSKCLLPRLTKQVHQVISPHHPLLPMIHVGIQTQRVSSKFPLWFTNTTNVILNMILFMGMNNHTIMLQHALLQARPGLLTYHQGCDHLLQTSLLHLRISRYTET